MLESEPGCKKVGDSCKRLMIDRTWRVLDLDMQLLVAVATTERARTPVIF